LGALRRHYRDHGWLVRVPRHVHEFAVAERTAREGLVARLGRQPSPAEVARELGVSLDSLLDAEDALHARNTWSLSAESDGGSALGDRLGREDRHLAAVDDRVAVTDALRGIEDSARELLYLYFFEERSQADIAERLGVSQMQVSRLLGAVLRRLRSRVGPR
ncbi:MAG: sigma-70 family RNA polymerase sigma factor, partial [Actinobacteria bacterium]|nr:sigma-70 family RNA polymerase sigma factor [Actinomycetota bacterium]